jgi:hypothetical protein
MLVTITSDLKDADSIHAVKQLFCVELDGEFGRRYILHNLIFPTAYSIISLLLGVKPSVHGRGVANECSSAPGLPWNLAEIRRKWKVGALDRFLHFHHPAFTARQITIHTYLGGCGKCRLLGDIRYSSPESHRWY